MPMMHAFLHKPVIDGKVKSIVQESIVTLGDLRLEKSNSSLEGSKVVTRLAT